MSEITFFCRNTKRPVVPAQVKAFYKLQKRKEKPSLTEYMVTLGSAFPLLDTPSKEAVFVDVLYKYPETAAYAMLKGATVKAGIKERYYDQYKKSYMVWLEGIETDLILGIGEENIDTFITYARLNINGMSENTVKLAQKVAETLGERDRLEWIHKKIY